MSDDEDEREEQSSQAGDEPIQKRYRRYHNVEFHDKLLVSVMIIVKAFGRKDLPFVHWMLFDEWHLQLKDETKHPRPKGFDPYKENFCCFKNFAEWSAYASICKGRGKVATGEVPTLTSQCQDWASKKFDKWQTLIREMQNVIHPEFVSQLFYFANAYSHASFAVQDVQSKTGAFRF
jgi:hypothetical protein